MPLKYSDVIQDVSRQELMSMIKFEKGFRWTYASIKCVESINNKQFDIYASKDTSTKKTKEWGFVESLVANDKYEARRYRRMKRYPEHNFAVIVNFTKDDTPIVRVHYLWDDKNAKIADLSLQMMIAEDFFEYMGWETTEEVTKWLQEKEEELDRMYLLHQEKQRKDAEELNAQMAKWMESSRENVLKKISEEDINEETETNIGDEKAEDTTDSEE